MVVGSVEVADQHTPKPVSQHLVHHLLAAPTSHEVPLRRRVERPHEPVDSPLPSASLIGRDHRAATDALPYLVHRISRSLRRPVDDANYRSLAQVQSVNAPQIPPDRPYRQPRLLPECRDQAHHVHSHTLPAHRHPAQLYLRRPPPSAHRAFPRDHCVLCHAHRRLRDIDHLTRAVCPSTAQSRPAIRADLHRVLHTLRRLHATASKALEPLLPRPLLACRPGACTGLVARHPPRPRHVPPTAPPTPRLDAPARRWPPVGGR